MLRKATEVLQKLENIHVRNLFWAVASPNLLTESAFPKLFPDHLMQEMWLENENWFYALDEKPKTLEEYTQKYHKGRLGHYFESLIRYFIERCPCFEVVLSNFQIIEDKITIGEIDLVFDWRGKRYHLEIAVKYFAMINDGLTWTDWVGPSGNDRLDVKLNHVLNHQIPLISHPQVARVVGNNLESFIFLKGKFFANDAIPNWVNTKQGLGKYVKEKDFRTFLKQEKISEIYLLQRPHWLADFEKVQPSFILNLEELLHQRTPILNPNNEAILYRVRRGKKFTDLFVVANDWPK
jgi:hypothetical protein